MPYKQVDNLSIANALQAVENTSQDRPIPPVRHKKKQKREKMSKRYSET